MAKDDKLADVHYDLANAYFNLETLDKAIAHYKQAIEINPEKGDYHYNMGNAYSLDEKYDLAI